MTKRGLAAYGNISASESTHALPSRLSPALPPLLPPNPFFSLFSLSPALSRSLLLPLLPLSFSLLPRSLSPFSLSRSQPFPLPLFSLLAPRSTLSSPSFLSLSSPSFLTSPFPLFLSRSSLPV